MHNVHYDTKQQSKRGHVGTARKENAPSGPERYFLHVVPGRDVSVEGADAMFNVILNSYNGAF